MNEPIKKQSEPEKKKRGFKIHRLVFLIFFVMANTFAWFIYVTKVDNNVSVHVKAWDVVFQTGDTELSSIVNVNVSDLYPGMDDYLYEITAYNKSEVTAILTYKILEVNILGTSYITTEGREELGQTPLATDLTSQQMEQRLLSNYPFTISFSISDSEIAEGNGSEDYSLSVVWPYENNNDAEDTAWGIAASNYKKSNPSASSITMKIKLSIVQNTN